MDITQIGPEKITEDKGHGTGYMKMVRIGQGSEKDKPVPDNFDNLESEDLYDYMTDEEKQQALEKLSKSAQEFLEALDGFVTSSAKDLYNALEEQVKDSGILEYPGLMLGKVAQKALENSNVKTALEYIGRYLEEVESSFPQYLDAELETLHKDFPEAADITAQILIRSITYDLRYSDKFIKEMLQEQGIQPTDELLKAIETAITAAKDKYFSDHHGEPEAENLLPTIKAKRLKEIGYPLDKVNGTLWAGVLERGIKRELKAETDVDSRRGKQANIYVLVDFDELDGVKISRNLDSYDKRVFIAVANLKRQGLDYVTAAQVYRAMGGRGTPSRKDRDKILESVKFISMGRVFIDNREEVKLYKKYDRISESFPLLATAIGEGYANGVLVDDVIHIIEAPRLMTFAENRGQIATVPIALLESPISMTAANLTLEDYLFTRIARMRNTPTLTRTILFTTIYERCGITTKKQKQRLPEKLERILEHYKTEKWINGYTITDHSIEVETYKK